MKSDQIVRWLTLVAALAAVGLAVWLYYQTPSLEYQRELDRANERIGLLENQQVAQTELLNKELDRVMTLLDQHQQSIGAAQAGADQGLSEIRRLREKNKQDQQAAATLTDLERDALLRRFLAEYEAAREKP